jgi:exosortase family protein XrtF
MTEFSIKEFRPTIMFLVKFLGIYLVGNLLYGFYVTAYSPAPDPLTRNVTVQTATALRLTGHEVEIEDHPVKATVMILDDGKSVVSVFEGCNGLNTAIIFIAFLFAFGPVSRQLIWFIPLGLLVLHVTNLLRIGGLFLIASYLPDFLYFTHKYLFTAVIYAVVFALWVWWVLKFARNTYSYAKT